MEHRGVPPVTVKSIADVTLENGSKGEAYVGGIRRNGLELYTKDEIMKGANLFLTLYFDVEGIDSSESVGGTVVWSAPFFKDSFVSRVVFDNSLTEEGHKNLLRFIEQVDRGM